MCGICGIYDFAQTDVITERLLKRMNDTLHHRGPDDEGVWSSPDRRVGLANRRLSIIDLSPAGHQPLSNEDGSVWIAYNGEIYNHESLRKHLTLDHKFHSRTDTEVLVHLYETYGSEMVHHLRGMFAFALWDAQRKRLLVVRDRLGIKPVYYAHVDGYLLFASEIKALFASGFVHPHLNREMLRTYLALGNVPAPYTLFTSIQKLEPGHMLVVDDNGLQKHRYWDIFQEVTSVNGCDENECLDQIEGKLEESVKLRLIADVPVGVFLSGGIDSSLIAAMAARNSGQPVKTFTLGFRGHPEYNELEYARDVAAHLGAESHEILIGPEELQEFFPRFLIYQEEPIVNPIWLATYFVSRLARDHGVIVVLSGDGGDELYAGYSKWMTYLRLYPGWKVFQSLPQPLRQASGGLLQKFLHQESSQEIVRRGIASEELFWGGTMYKPEQLDRLLAPDLKLNGQLWRFLPISNWHKQFINANNHSNDYLSWMTYAALKGDLLEDYLMRLDKMGMAASIEGRVPFLDHEFVSLSLSIPASLKYPNFQNKFLLRQIALRYLPKNLVNRPKKGFCAPVESWLAESFGDSLQEGLDFLQSKEKVFDQQWFLTTQKSIRNHLTTSAHWGLLSLGQWYMQWMNFQN